MLKMVDYKCFEVSIQVHILSLSETFLLLK